MPTKSASCHFSRIAIIGPGLLGGSVALAIRQHLPDVSCRVWARRQAVLDTAQQLGIEETYAYAQLHEAVAGADLIILCTPIDYFRDLILQMLPALEPSCLITDVGSVKLCVHEDVGALLSRRGYRFIGSHPMAGSEKQGFEHASAQLIAGKVVALTNDQHCSESSLRALSHFWSQLGMRPYRITAKEHDNCVARISHVPHILAALCARAAYLGDEELDRQHLQKLAATGFRDTSRVSLGATDMWEGILQENSQAILPILEYSLQDLTQLISALRERAGVEAWLSEGKEAREAIMPSGRSRRSLS